MSKKLKKKKKRIEAEIARKSEPMICFYSHDREERDKEHCIDDGFPVDESIDNEIRLLLVRLILHNVINITFQNFTQLGDCCRANVLVVSHTIERATADVMFLDQRVG